MSIQRKPKSQTEAQQDAFIAAAPDGGHSQTPVTAVYEKGIAKGHKRQISLTIAPDMLRRVDDVAKRTGQARAAVINMALYRALEGDIFK
ncbi:CopG family transcriptional regulator [Acidiphilium acidophilum]|uniref:CopG family transcriptional regulator n=1 Tax=Acidiphilium acidophilum TaxID=76588 RepID=A0AAW9DK34_ACIAO|nr:CopG family transcriptional regulator [Acidiphilium acidophilum]MDX5929383.1 CopG family transcriptional regulator [Acidiphilium acidophilum]GBQ06117.1 hypothetical protein AA700_0811 [Acidiphilium acidophilum DSM 700]